MVGVVVGMALLVHRVTDRPPDRLPPSARRGCGSAGPVLKLAPTRSENKPVSVRHRAPGASGSAGHMRPCPHVMHVTRDFHRALQGRRSVYLHGCYDLVWGVRLASEQDMVHFACCLVAAGPCQQYIELTTNMAPWL